MNMNQRVTRGFYCFIVVFPIQNHSATKYLKESVKLDPRLSFYFYKEF